MVAVKRGMWLSTMATDYHLIKYPCHTADPFQAPDSDSETPEVNIQGHGSGRRLPEVLQGLNDAGVFRESSQIIRTKV